MNYFKTLSPEQQEKAHSVIINHYMLRVVDYIGNTVSKTPFCRIEVLLEEPKNMVGVYCILSCSVVNEDGVTIHMDGTAVDNTIFYSKKEIYEQLSKRYEVSSNSIVIEFAMQEPSYETDS